MIDLTSSVSEKIFLQWVLFVLKKSILSDREVAKLNSQLELPSTLQEACITDRPLLEVYQELLSEQELR